MHTPVRVIITRTPFAARRLLDELSGGSLGAQGEVQELEFACLPLHQAELVTEPEQAAVLSQLDALRRGDFDVLTLTSRNGVRALEQLLASPQAQVQGFAPSLAEVLAPVGIAVVGEGTAHELEPRGLKADFIPTVQDARAMVEQWPSHWGNPGGHQKILCIQGENARPTLSDGLATLGHSVKTATVYQMSPYPAQNPLEKEDQSYGGLRPLTLEEALGKNKPAQETLLLATAPSLLRAFHQGWQEQYSGDPTTFPQVIAIGRTTYAAAQELGLKVTLSPSPSPQDLARTTQKLVKTISTEGSA